MEAGDLKDLERGDLVRGTAQALSHRIGQTGRIEKIHDAMPGAWVVWGAEEDASYARASEIEPIVSRASDTPRPWPEMSRDQRREISFAAMSGDTIELLAECAGLSRWLTWDGKTPLCDIHQPLRVKPAPVRETERVMIRNMDGLLIGNGDVTTINGKPDWSTLKGEDL